MKVASLKTHTGFGETYFETLSKDTPTRCYSDGTLSISKSRCDCIFLAIVCAKIHAPSLPDRAVLIFVEGRSSAEYESLPNSLLGRSNRVEVGRARREPSRASLTGKSYHKKALLGFARRALEVEGLGGARSVIPNVSNFAEVNAIEVFHELGKYRLEYYVGESRHSPHIVFVLETEEDFSEGSRIVVEGGRVLLVEFDVKRIALVESYEGEKSLVSKLKRSFVASHKRVEFDSKGKALTLSTREFAFFEQSFHLISFVRRGVITSNATNILSKSRGVENYFALGQKKYLAFRLGIFVVGPLLASRNLGRSRRARRFFRDCRDLIGALFRFRLRALRRLRDLRRAAFASSPDTFEERHRAVEFRFNFGEGFFLLYALLAKSVDEVSATEVSGFFAFSSHTIIFQGTEPTYFDSLEGVLSLRYVETRLAPLNRLGRNHRKSMVESDAWHGLSESRTPNAKVVPIAPIKSRNSSDRFSTIGPKIIHSYTPPGAVFFRREGKDSAELETAFFAPYAALGAILPLARYFEAFRSSWSYRQFLPLSTPSEPSAPTFSTPKPTPSNSLLLLAFLRYVLRYVLRNAFLNDILTDNVTCYYLNTSTPSIPSGYEVLSLCAKRK
jgi:hypothetical protein